MRTLLAALSMLTAFPVGKNFVPTEDEIRRTPFCFPLIGIGIGLISALIGQGVLMAFPHLAAAALLTFLSELPTRAFHLDGLADTADGFLSSRSRERILEIMHDSRIGTMGVLAIAAWSLIKFSAFAVLPEKSIPAVLFFMSLNGRCAMVYHLLCSRYARAEGLGRLVFERKPISGAVLSLLCSFGLMYAVFPPVCLTVPGAVLIFGLLWSVFTWKTIGGGTGDTLGAVEELSEILTLLIFISMAAKNCI